jgi:signal transduction histidine kinase
MDNVWKISERLSIIENLNKAKEKAEKNEIQLRELNTTKDKLFSIIAHDLRSPFTSIIGLSEILLEDEIDTSNEQTEEYISIINSTAKETNVLLDNLLNWAKSQTGGLRLILENISLSEIIQEIVELNISLAKAKNISIHFPTKADIELHTDKNILKTILRNIISNAIKFTEIAGNINISATSNQNHIEISISDNGVGMSQETISKLFDISTNTTLPGTSSEKGSGLGLIVCKEFVEKLGGHIWVESEVDKGSDFRFTLPLSNSK